MLSAIHCISKEEVPEFTLPPADPFVARLPFEGLTVFTQFHFRMVSPNLYETKFVLILTIIPISKNVHKVNGKLYRYVSSQLCNYATYTKSRNFHS